MKKRISDNEQMLLSLIQTQRSHIDTLISIIKHIQDELKLCVPTKETPVDVSDQQQIIKELIYWIDLLLKEEEK